MQLTVINKIKLGFGLFGCLLLVTSVLSYFGLSDIRVSAEDVVERKMPVQTRMVEVKTEILSLSVITANGYHEDSLNALGQNKAQFDSLSASFVNDLEGLRKAMPSNSMVKDAVDASNNYVTKSKAMYNALESRMKVQIEVATKLEEVLSTADEASALMLDLSYLDTGDPGIETLIGTGTNIDNKLLTMNETFSELATNNNAETTQNIVDDLQYQISNLQVDKDYLNRLAVGVDDGGTVDMFNEQFDLLLSRLNDSNGLIALQQQKLAYIADASSSRSEAKDALEASLSFINTLFDKVQAESIAGQNAILESVQANLLKNLIVACIGLIAAISLAVVATRSIARPLGNINKGLTQLSKGDLSHKLPEDGNDEFSALSAKVNSLTDSLRELVGNILEQEKRLIEITKESVSLGEKSLRDVDEQREQVTTTSTNTQHVQDTSRSNLVQINDAMNALRHVTEQSTEIGMLVEKSRNQFLGTDEIFSKSK